MKNYFYCVLCSLLVVSCSKKTESTQQEHMMYEPSEMALLMRKMYEYNRVLRENIEANDTFIAFPEDFSKIHSAELTDPTERDTSFQLLSEQYLQLQQSVMLERDSAKVYFNKTINSCVACHQTRCDGPIPKIKRLLIK